MRASIPRLLRCERSALPTELIALNYRPLYQKIPQFSVVRNRQTTCQVHHYHQRTNYVSQDVYVSPTRQKPLSKHHHRHAGLTTTLPRYPRPPHSRNTATSSTQSSALEGAQGYSVLFQKIAISAKSDCEFVDAPTRQWSKRDNIDTCLPFGKSLNSPVSTYFSARGVRHHVIRQPGTGPIFAHRAFVARTNSR